MDKELNISNEVLRNYPGASLVFLSHYYVMDGVVHKAIGNPKDYTLEDIRALAKPENRVIIQTGKDLECYFPNSEHDKVEYYLDTYSVPRGFTYTLYTCDTLYNADKE